MSALERQSRISAYLAERGYASLNELVDEFQVSVSTVRRDLDDMEQRGNVKRTHGGAFHVEAREHPLDYGLRESKNRDAKKAIGALTASLVHDGESVLLDGGTTTYAVAEYLLGRRMQVVTNSLPIADSLGKRSETEVVFLGGLIMSGTGLTLGRWAEDMLRSVHLGRAVMGVAGIMPDGLFNANLLMVELQRQMIEAADEVIVVVDHSKFGRRSLVRVGDLKCIDRIITDSKTDEKWLDILRNEGVQVHVAEVEGDKQDTAAEPVNGVPYRNGTNA